MPSVINRHCPQCGRKAHDRLLVQCPDCRVPFVEVEPSPAGLTPEQLSLLVSQVFGSWKFWAALLLIVGGAAWAVVLVADRVIDARAKTYLAALQQDATNHIGAAFGQISNQIALEFRQPKIKAAIEQAARDRATDIFTNGVRPALEAFQDALDLANTELARSSNAIAQLETDARAAQRRIPPPAPVVAAQTPIPAQAPVVQAAVTPVTRPTPAPATPSDATADAPVKLSLINRTLTPAGTGYILTLFFQTTGSSSSGNVTVEAGTYKQTARILNFASMSSSPPLPPTLTETGDAARLQFAVSTREAPTLVLELSAPTILRLVSNSFDTDLTIPVAADKMQLPAANK
ncbi:MAG: hypothetical protein JWQ04_2122 [Pedosphaera sp.]|nr:hypothetical protein [Pedosphaera sp.]